MNSMLMVSRQVKRMAGLVAVIATALTFGGTLTLLEHYAHSGVDRQDHVARTHQSEPAVSNQAQNGSATAISRKAG